MRRIQIYRLNFEGLFIAQDVAVREQ